MQQLEIIEIEDRVKRTSNRIKNAGNIPLYKKGITYAKRIKAQTSYETAALLEVEYIKLLKEEYLPKLPATFDTKPAIINMSDGYDDPADKEDDSKDGDDSNDSDNSKGGDTTDDSKSGDTTDDDSQDDGYDVDAAIDTLNENANDLNQYEGHCARNVREALEAGGVDTTGHPVDAKDYGPFLEGRGFSEQPDADVDHPEKGDIVVIQPNDDGSHPSGHIAMYDGQNWVSDAEQRNYSAGLTGDYTIYRR